MGLDHGIYCNGQSLIGWRKEGNISDWMRYKIGFRAYVSNYYLMPPKLVQEFVKLCNEYIIRTDDYKRNAFKGEYEHIVAQRKIAQEVLDKLVPLLNQPNANFTYWESW